MSTVTLHHSEPRTHVVVQYADLQPFQQRLHGQCWRIAKRQSTLNHIMECFRDQPTLLPLQCQDAIQELDALRRALRSMHEFLVSLDQNTVERLRPWAVIDKLTMLDFLLTEVILSIAMFAPLCQAVAPARVELHLSIRSLFPRLLATYQDTLSQLVALMSRERQEVQQ